MCIIVVKQAGIAAPSDEMFENMWNHNPYGAGFMYTANGGVCIEKGFMEYKDFYKAYKRVEGKIDTVQTPMIFHFRITTHGGTSPENTHSACANASDKPFRIRYGGKDNGRFSR